MNRIHYSSPTIRALWSACVTAALGKPEVGLILWGAAALLLPSLWAVGS